ncbi:MAG: hypothetical protein LC116_05320 [Bacteroidetes bacterium]|nr:hypothetical protein [Bacteroidota bacterium]MCZ2132600.1 hypothetical protein [Bacteroidota bacterium]
MKLAHGTAVLAAMCALCFAPVRAQQTGRVPTAADFDTTFVFASPRPLIADSLAILPAKYIWGMNVFVTGSGYGGGMYYQRFISKTFSAFADLAISGARNTDEQEFYDPYTNSYRVPGKINRLFLFPLMLGAQYRVLAETFDDTFRPFIALGIGPSFILATPYDREFFGSFGYGTLYVKFGGFAGLGANIGSFGRSVSSISLRYYVIPFGNGGLESIRNLPITDFGGAFLTLSVGWAY